MNAHWREEDSIESVHYQRDGELAYSRVWSVMDFTVPWKYLTIKWEITILNMHLPGRKKEWRREGGAFAEVDAKFSLLPLRPLFWETLHPLVAFVQRDSTNQVPA